MWRRLARWLMAVGVVGGLVFGISGGWQDPWLWAYVGTWALMSMYVLFTIDEDLARERFTPPEPGADRVALRAVQLVALSHLVTGALDTGRLHLTTVEPAFRVAGFIGMVISGVVMFHAMLSNRFFSSVVRIQKERGHTLVDSGPYAVVRHPGYLGMLFLVPFSGLALGSWLSVGVGLIYSAMILRRVLFEDAFLTQNLDGYADYTRRVRYRLVPRVF